MKTGQIIGVVVGIALMVAPAVAGYVDAPAGDVHRTIGPIAVTFAIVAMSEATAGVRLANYALVPILAASPLLGGHPAAATVVGVAAGSLLAAFTCRGGRPTHRIGGGWRALRAQAGAPE